jgi:aryl-alcohol dehydrogenase-like predicted oxidoreductase
MKLVLGSAQLGTNYGILNNKKINIKEFKKITNLVLRSKIKFIDTSSSYGNSEEIIGGSKLKNLNIISKIKLPKKIKISNMDFWLQKKICKTLNLLNVNNIYGLLIHDYKDLLGINGKNYLTCLKKLKKNKIIKKIGISIYSPKELNIIWRFWKPDIVQAPLNVFDTRISDSGWLDILKKNKVEIFIRSIFLQGLLVNDYNNIKISKNLEEHLNKFQLCCKKKNISKLVACINFIKSFKKVNYVIVGINNCDHLKNVVDIFYSKDRANLTKKFNTNNLNLIDPRRWRY